MVLRSVALICLMLLAFSATAASNKKNPRPVDSSKYYSTASGKNGEALKRAFNSIIRGRKRFASTCVWDIYTKLNNMCTPRQQFADM